MNYRKIYQTLIEHRISNPVSVYLEKHHILPKSIYPYFKSFSKFPWNKVNLTAREHFIAHLLLAKIYGNKLIYAANMMSNFKKYNSKKYSWLKEKHSKNMSFLHKGKIISEETRKKISEGNKNKPKSELHKKAMDVSRKGRKHTKETKSKMKEIAKNRTFSEGTKQKMRLSKIGRKQSQETINKRVNTFRIKRENKNMEEEI